MSSKAEVPGAAHRSPSPYLDFRVFGSSTGVRAGIEILRLVLFLDGPKRQTVFEKLLEGRRSVKRLQIFNLTFPHELVKPRDGEFPKVRGGAMRFESGLVDILLVDHDRGGVAFDGMRNVVYAAGLFTGRLGEMVEAIGGLLAISVGKAQTNDETDHSSPILEQEHRERGVAGRHQACFRAIAEQDSRSRFERF